VAFDRRYAVNRRRGLWTWLSAHVRTPVKRKIKSLWKELPKQSRDTFKGDPITHSDRRKNRRMPQRCGEAIRRLINGRQKYGYTPTETVAAQPPEAHAVVEAGSSTLHMMAWLTHSQRLVSQNDLEKSRNRPRAGVAGMSRMAPGRNSFASTQGTMKCVHYSPTIWWRNTLPVTWFRCVKS